MRKRGIIWFLLAALLLSCSPKALREAEEVVAQADSMRAAGQMYGIDAGDSATLAIISGEKDVVSMDANGLQNGMYLLLLKVDNKVRSTSKLIINR